MSAALALSAARGATLEALEALDRRADRVAHAALTRAEIMLSAHLPALDSARRAVVAAMASVSADWRQARVDLVHAERTIAELAAEYTPVQPPQARKASGTFASVAAVLAAGRDAAGLGPEEPDRER